MVTIPGRDPLNIRLGQNQAAGQVHKLAALQRLEELKVEPDELVSYYMSTPDVLW